MSDKVQVPTDAAVASVARKPQNTRTVTRSMGSFVPEIVKHYIFKRRSEALVPPITQDFDTVALFADVSGFTALSEKLARHGPMGSEWLGFYLNRYLESLGKYSSPLYCMI
jgi:class 3 adenylate cyclase